MKTFILCMRDHPEVLRKAQKEMDEVLCVNAERRLPKMEDREKLVYLDCVIKEAAR